MKIYASAKIKDSPQDIVTLLRAFYSECNDEKSSYEINCGKLKVELDFDEFPVQAVTAICNCENFRISSKQLQDDEAISVLEASTTDVPQKEEASKMDEKVTFAEEEQKKKEIPETENESGDEKVKKEELEDKVDLKSQKNEKKVRRLNVNIPELKEIIATSDSVEQEIDQMAEFFELGKQKELFKIVLEAALNIESTVSWKKIQNELAPRNIQVACWEQNKFNKAIKEKLGMTMLDLLKALVEESETGPKVLKDTSDDCRVKENLEEVHDGLETVKDNIEQEQLSEVQEEVIIKVIPQKNRIKMGCMPEIPWFEEGLASIDKAQPIEEKVDKVLNTLMELRNLEQKRQRYISEISIVSMKLSIFDVDSVMKKTSIPSSDQIRARMYFYDFINKFAGKQINATSDIKVNEFLADLSKVLS